MSGEIHDQYIVSGGGVTFRRRRLPAAPGTCTETFCEECRALCRVEVMANHCGEEHSPQFGLNRIKKARVSFRSFDMSSIRFCPALSICDFLALLYFALFFFTSASGSP